MSPPSFVGSGCGKVALSCDLNPVRDFTTSTATFGPDALLKGRARDNMAHRVPPVGLEYLRNGFKLKLAESL